MKPGLVLSVGLALVCGCGSGGRSGSVVYVRRVNVGLDLDTWPAIVELAVFGYDEEVAMPTFENGEAPAVLAKVCRPPTHLKRDGLTIGRLLASGGAAVALSVPAAWAMDAGTLEDIGGLRESDTDRTTWRTRGRRTTLGARSSHAVYTATTSVGFGLELSATTWEPTALRVGFHRKETYVAPFSGGVNKTNPWDQRRAGTPSVLAMLEGIVVERHTQDARTDKGSPRTRRTETKVQFFATGRSATETCLLPDVRSVILEDLIQYPRVARKSKYER